MQISRRDGVMTADEQEVLRQLRRELLKGSGEDEEYEISDLLDYDDRPAPHPATDENLDLVVSKLSSVTELLGTIAGLLGSINGLLAVIAVAAVVSAVVLVWPLLS